MEIEEGDATQLWRFVAVLGRRMLHMAAARNQALRLRYDSHEYSCQDTKEG
jgi:hypothetical protein